MDRPASKPFRSHHKSQQTLTSSKQTKAIHEYRQPYQQLVIITIMIASSTMTLRFVLGFLLTHLLISSVFAFGRLGIHQDHDDEHPQAVRTQQSDHYPTDLLQDVDSDKTLHPACLTHIMKFNQQHQQELQVILDENEQLQRRIRELEEVLATHQEHDEGNTMTTSEY